MEHSLFSNIVIVDDDEFILEILCTVFDTENGFSAVSYRQASQALDYLKDNAAKLIIMDLGLPDMDGIEMIQAIKSNDAYRNIHVVILSGSDEPHLKRKALDAGAAAFFTKPFNPQQLRDYIKGLIFSGV